MPLFSVGKAEEGLAKFEETACLRARLGKRSGDSTGLVTEPHPARERLPNLFVQGEP